MSDRTVIYERLAMLPPPGQNRWADRYAVDVPYLLAALSMHEPPWVKPEADVALLRSVLSEYVAGNRIVDGYWYSPDEPTERQCPRCKGERGGWVRLGGDDWDWEPCALCGEAGYLVVDGQPHFRNDPATADELALVESLRTEVGL